MVDLVAIAGLFSYSVEEVISVCDVNGDVLYHIGLSKEILWEKSLKRIRFRSLLYDYKSGPIPDLGCWPDQHRDRLEFMKIVEDPDGKVYLEWFCSERELTPGRAEALSQQTKKILDLLYFEITVMDEMEWWIQYRLIT